MEWSSGATDLKFYRAFNSLPQVENSVIDYDIKNIHKVLIKRNPVTGETVAKRLNTHYNDGMRHIKRSFGNKITDDFQRYTWGLTLAVDLGLEIDKLELLTQVYCKKVPMRYIRSEFEKIVTVHTSFRRIKDRAQKNAKWRELKASWNMTAIKEPGFPTTVTKKGFLAILDINEIKFDIHVEMLTRDIQMNDLEANKLHMLLLKDPVIEGTLLPDSSTKTHRIQIQTDVSRRGRNCHMERPVISAEAMVKLRELKYRQESQEKQKMDAFLAEVAEEEALSQKDLQAMVEESMRSEKERRLMQGEDKLSKRVESVFRQKLSRERERQENVARVLLIKQQRIEEEERRKSVVLSSNHCGEG